MHLQKIKFLETDVCVLLFSFACDSSFVMLMFSHPAKNVVQCNYL